MRGLLILLAIIAFGCSTDEDPQIIVVDAPTTPVADADYFHLQINESAVSIDIPNPNGGWNRGSITKGADYFTINAICGHTGNNPWSFANLTMTFDLTGKLISASQRSQSNNGFGVFYYDYFKHFPSNYFNINIISIDETLKRVKLEFSGNLYQVYAFGIEPSLDSERSAVSGQLDMQYNDQPDSVYTIPNTVPQYCTAKLNGENWRAYYEHQLSVFTSTDPYKIETHFSASTPIGSYTFNDSSTDNYVRFSKFNTTTLTYDTYSAQGTISYSYKEYHGANSYSFIGTFSFTAVNLTNPSDIIQVTDGSFRSRQSF